jgi:hypothetical protein
MVCAGHGTWFAAHRKSLPSGCRFSQPVLLGAPWYGQRMFMAGLGRPNELSDLQLNAPSSNRIRTSTTARIKLIEDRIESGFAPASDLAQLAPFYP